MAALNMRTLALILLLPLSSSTQAASHKPLPSHSTSGHSETQARTRAYYGHDLRLTRKDRLLFHWTGHEIAEKIREHGPKVPIGDAFAAHGEVRGMSYYETYGEGFYVADGFADWMHLDGVDDVVVLRHDGKLRVIEWWDRERKGNVSLDHALELGVDAYEDEHRLVLKNMGHVELIPPIESRRILRDEVRNAIASPALRPSAESLFGSPALEAVARRYLSKEELRGSARSILDRHPRERSWELYRLAAGESAWGAIGEWGLFWWRRMTQRPAQLP